LERVVRVVEGLVDAGAPVGPRALARQTGIDRSAVGRILQQLALLGVLTRENGGYAPGPRLFALTRVLAASDTFPAAANAVLNDLVDRFDETCYVCVLHGDAVVFLHECQSSKPLRFVVDLGQPVALHAGAAGRAILAGLPRSEAEALIGTDPLERHTDQTFTDPAALLDMAADERKLGYTVSRGERVEGGLAIAAPFFDGSGACQGSIVFTSPLSRHDERLTATIGDAVAAAARTLSARLGASLDQQ
jgi:IclR family acetate operon transcriptional repressor